MMIGCRLAIRSHTIISKRTLRLITLSRSRRSIAGLSPIECRGRKKRLELCLRTNNNVSFMGQRNMTTTTIVDQEEEGGGGDCKHEKEARQHALADLFHQYAHPRQLHGPGSPPQSVIDVAGLGDLLVGIGEGSGNDGKLEKLFEVADTDGNGYIDLPEFLEQADFILGGNPARIILIVGGPGSGKGVLSRRLQRECHCVHLSSGDMLRQEVEADTLLGQQVGDIMARGKLVSSAMMVALMKRRMLDHPSKRVLLDGFPRSLENAHDLMTLCGKPEVALHLMCDDTVLLERIMGRGAGKCVEKGDRNNVDNDGESWTPRDDDNFETALQRLRTFHKYQPQTLAWLAEQHVPIVNLDGSGSPESVWNQLQAIGRLMRPAVKSPPLPM